MFLGIFKVFICKIHDQLLLWQSTNGCRKDENLNSFHIFFRSFNLQNKSATAQINSCFKLSKKALFWWCMHNSHTKQLVKPHMYCVLSLTKVLVQFGQKQFSLKIVYILILERTRWPRIHFCVRISYHLISYFIVVV